MQNQKDVERLPISEEEAIELVRDLYAYSSDAAREQCVSDTAIAAILFLSAHIQRNLAGWALAYRIGKDVIDRHKEIQDIIGVDNGITRIGTDYESVGYAAISGHLSGVPVEIQRSVVISLLGSLGYMNILKILADNITALNYGEVVPLFVPAATGCHGSGYTLSQLRAIAVDMVRKLVKRGYKKNAALEKVAKHYACSPNTILSWEKRLRKRLGNDAEGYKKFFGVKLSARPDSDEMSDMDYDAFIEIFGFLYREILRLDKDGEG